ncbi:MAG: BrnT family toxin [Alphaproteobacteria bacterium]|nr:BrnT family toxin [Alphaproteobacteria bacterium]
MALVVFADPNAEEYIDDRLEYGEVRRRIYGLYFNGCVCITYTMRDKIHRIISICRVHKKEREEYYD